MTSALTTCATDAPTSSADSKCLQRSSESTHERCESNSHGGALRETNHAVKRSGLREVGVEVLDRRVVDCEVSVELCGIEQSPWAKPT